MKRRPRLQLKPNIPSKSGASKVDVEPDTNNDLASIETVVAQDAMDYSRNSDNKISGKNVRLSSNDEEVKSMTPSITIQAGVAKDRQNHDGCHPDHSIPSQIAKETDCSLFKKESIGRLLGEPASVVEQESGGSSYAENNTCSVTAAPTDDPNTVEHASNSSAVVEPLLSQNANSNNTENSCSQTMSSDKDGSNGQSSQITATSSSDVAKAVGNDAQATKNDAALPVGGQCDASSEKTGRVADCETKPSRRFTRIRPNLSSIARQKQGLSTDSSSSIADPSSKLQSPNTETNTVIPDKSSDIVENGLKARTDIVESVRMDAEPLKPSGTTIEEGKSLDVTDGCKPVSVPMSPQSASTRIPHQFTKMRPNLPQIAKTKKSSGAETLSNVHSSNAEDEPLIPPPVLLNKQPSSGIEPPASFGESVVYEESVVLPESAVKAAAKVIERKLKEKRKKRAVENIETPVDASKVCMRDLIYMNPVNNPMKSKSGETKQNGSGVASSAGAGSAPTPTASAADSVQPTKKNFSAPQLKIKEDGSIVLDEASLIIERQPVKTYDHIEAIDETDMVRCGYPRRTRTRAWSKKETRKFFAALSMIGTDFFLMAKFFRKRTRPELKSKFKREEKIHPAMVETALKERLSLDMSVMMAVGSSDEEDVKSKPRKTRPAERSGPKRNGKLLRDDGKDKGQSVGGKENELQTSSIAKTEKKRRANEKQQPGKKPKRMKSRYYEESSDEDEEEIVKAAESDADSSSEEDFEGHAKVSSVRSSDDDETEIVNCMSQRPTRSGRVPKPVKLFNEVRISDIEEQLNNFDLPTSRKHVSVKKKLPNVQTVFSPTQPARLISPPSFPSSSCAPDSSTYVLHSPMPSLSSSSACVSVCPSSSSSSSAQLPFIPVNIPPGKQLMILASPIMQGESKEPAHLLLDFLLVSSPEPDLNCRNQAAIDNIRNESGDPGDHPTDRLLFPSRRTTTTANNEASVDDAKVPVGSDSSTVLPIRTARLSNDCTVSEVNSVTVGLTQNGNSVSSGCVGNRLNILSEICLGKSSASSLNEMQLETSDRTLTSDISVSPMLSQSALGYCVTQLPNMDPLPLDFSSGDFQSSDANRSADEDSELEGTVTDIMQQDDGTVVLVAESIRPVDRTSEMLRLS